jgi:hypothetical protein
MGRPDSTARACIPLRNITRRDFVDRFQFVDRLPPCIRASTRWDVPISLQEHVLLCKISPGVTLLTGFTSLTGFNGKSVEGISRFQSIFPEPPPKSRCKIDCLTGFPA